MTFLKYLKFVIVTLVLAGCGTAGRKQSTKLRNLVNQRQFQEAETFVNSEKFYPEKESRLLKLLELGSIQYLNGHYFQSLKTFDKAKELSDQLYTVSISKKITSAVSNSNFDNYYGEKYERSMIRFYQSLNHFMLSQVGKYEAYEIISRDKDGKEVGKKPVAEVVLSPKQRAQHMGQSLNVLIEWNSLLDNFKSTSGGVVSYKDDLLAKVYGAFIHEQTGRNQDRRTALLLYKKAKDVLFKNFNTLETYNGKSEKFRDDLKKLSNMPRSKVEAQYVQQTNHAKELLSFLDERIKELGKRKKDNLFVLIEEGFITPKKAKKVDIPLPFSGKFSGKGFISFCANILGAATNTQPKIYFELPQIPYEPIKGETVLLIQKDGKTVKKEKLAIVNPLANLASMIMDENAVSTGAKIGARVAGKHVAALFAAYGTYTISKKKMGDMLAMGAATLTYAGANKAIEGSERADLRTWSLLPHHFQVASLDLSPGTYTLLLQKTTGQGVMVKKVGNVTLDKKKAKLVSFRAF